MAELFGRYRLDDRLGQGGMGVVYRAWDTVLERVVALKMVLSHGEDPEPDVRERFLREARAAAHLTHKNIVTIYDLGEHEGQPYFAMEFLEGEDLQRRLARPEKTSVWRKIDIAIEICQGMEFAHLHGVVHRDLKPANIFITSTGGVKILDFGLARLMSSQMTRSNMLMGTLNYLSPEQVRGERADQQSDVFSIGVVLYELFGGRRAFEGDTAAATLYKILQEIPEPLWKLDGDLPRELATIVDRALAKPRDERYPDMASLRHDLESVRAASFPPGPSSPWPRPSTLSYADVTQPILRTPTPVPVPSQAPAAQPASTPAVPQGGATRGFWAGATVGALALAAVVVWLVMHHGAVSTPPGAKGPTATDPGSTPAGSSPTVSASSSTARTPDTQAATPADPVQPAPAAPAPQPESPVSAGKRPSSDKPASDKAGATRKREAPTTAVASKPGAEPTPAQPPEAKPQESTPASSQAAAPQPPPQPAPQPAPPPAPTVPVTSSPTIPPASQPPVAPPPEPPALNAERANDLLNRYKAALEAKSLDQLRRIWPTMSSASETAVRQEFEHAARITVAISDQHVSASGSTGKITFVRNYNVVTVEGQRLQHSTQATMDVHRSGDAWLIEAIRFTPR